MQNRPNIRICIVRTISNIFAEHWRKDAGEMLLTYKQPKVIYLTIKFSNLLMRILDSTLAFSNLAVETQSHQLLLSGIKHLNNKCVAVLLTLRNILLTATIIPVNSNRTVFNSTLQLSFQ